MRVLLAICLLCGFAGAQTVHSNSLSWATPAVSAPVVISGYQVYKASVSKGYNKPLVKLTAAQTSYVDTTVKANEVAFYVVTTLCDVCTTKESPFSAEVKAQTPADTVPSAPPVIQAPSFIIISR